MHESDWHWPGDYLVDHPRGKNRLILVLESDNYRHEFIYIDGLFVLFSRARHSIDKEQSNTTVLACLESDSRVF